MSEQPIETPFGAPVEQEAANAVPAPPATLEAGAPVTPAPEAQTVPSVPAPPVESEPTPEVEESSEPAPVDQVALVSYNADGTPCQSPGFIVIGEDEKA